MLPEPAPLDTVQILDLPVHNVNMDSALGILDRFVRSGTPHHVVTADASMLVMAQSDPELHAIIRGAELVTPDSAGILWAASKQGHPLDERVSGVEIVEQLCARSGEGRYRLFFFGAGPGVAEKAAKRMRKFYPDLQVVGTRNGFFTPQDEQAIVAEIRTAKPDVLCVALGIPKQEKWIARHKDDLGVPVLIGVGGTFDVLSGSVRRAPRVIQRARLEWLWRFLKNPRKINKIVLLPRFVSLVNRASRMKVEQQV